MEKGKDLVRYSRAGDVFHYRWAARRCLKMIHPKSRLQSISIEGSKNPEMNGECVIDIAEYSASGESDSREVVYLQLKHTTVRNAKPFKLSDLKGAITGFAKRYSEHFCENSKIVDICKVTFSIVTNRPIEENIKQSIYSIGKGDNTNTTFQNTLKSYTKLDDEYLKKFCSLLEFFDGEGNYISQRCELHAEISQLLAGTIDNSQIDTITALVQEKALPNSDGRIYREDILKRFGFTSEKSLFPAPSKFKNLDTAIPRKQHQTLTDYILHTTSPIIIHATGGVGKSVFANQVANSLPSGSIGIVYDCFGGGLYRNRSETRHRYRDALVQIANELAADGLCDPLIAQSIALDDEILRAFLMRLDMSIKSLKKSNQTAILAVLIDAADNAEMAAKEFNENCFVRQLLRESIPDGCRLIALCRTERIALIDPSNAIPRLELEPFSPEETLAHLKLSFPQATYADGIEFHRLTNNGNPRVQAYALGLKINSIGKTLERLGPSGATVEEQIEAQLNSVITNIKEKFSTDYQKHIDAICVGLATLPPLIPLSVIAAAAEVDETTVQSLAADLGVSLRILDASVHFRDEPTETWFQKKFSATSEQIESYVIRLKPLAGKYTYVAMALPFLLLWAGKYSELIDLALSDDFLPQDNPIDKRNVRVYRLQFAFKAALRSKQYVDAVKLALLAGEEVAGDKRQLELLTKNVDLIAPLQNEQRVQELAFRRVLRSGWNGSENVYSASLLSSVENFKGEARCHLRAANNWLHLYFDECEKKKDEYHHPCLIKDEDILELAFSYLNLFGVPEAVNFILSWKPPDLVYRISKNFIRKLVDIGNFEVVNDISIKGFLNPYLTIALTHELLEVGRFPSVNAMTRCLALLSTSRNRIPKPDYIHGDTITLSIVSFAEACASSKMSKMKILRMLDYYVPIKASRPVSNNHNENLRDVYLRAMALRYVLTGIYVKIDEMLPENYIQKEKKYNYEQDIRNFKEIVEGLLPWYIARANVIVQKTTDILDAINDADQRSKYARTQRYKEYDVIPYEISRICVDLLAFCKNLDSVLVGKFYTDHLKDNNKIWIQDRLKAVRSACRLDHLSTIKRDIEQSAYDEIASSKESPEIKSEWFITLARAVFSMCSNDSKTYFGYAVDVVSKFGDEVVQRWEAVVALANRCAEGDRVSPELAYRFIRCAELVGDNVDHDFDYKQAIRTGVRLSPVSALAALSRWRDRDVGCFEEQLPALAHEIISLDFLSPSVGWSLSTFYETHRIDELASLCIEKEQSAICRQYILEKAIRDYSFNEATKENLQKLKTVADKHSIKNSQLESIFFFYTKNPVKKIDKQTSLILHPIHLDKSGSIEWGKKFDGLDLTTSSGINQALKFFRDSMTNFLDYDSFWQEVLKRISENKVKDFLDTVVVSEMVDWQDIQKILENFPADWYSKISIKENWSTFFKAVGRRFAVALTNRYIFDSFLDYRIISKYTKFLSEGIVEGLAETPYLSDARTFFGFIKIAIPFITSQETKKLLEFSLVRFEMHMDDECADGDWKEWLNPPEDICTAFSGFIWSALGSPRAETRWRAAHCVRRLAEANCEAEIASLIKWLEKDKVGAFGSHKFPFYNLHARLYLMIALARISCDTPQILRCHNKIFIQYALESLSHILIQKFSADIAINIEKNFPNTYNNDIVNQLSMVGVSPFPVKEVDNHSKKIESYWHTNGEIDTSIKFYHAYDFDRYWFEPLGDVFGISGKQVEELATDVVINEWHVEKTAGSVNHDPRIGLWSSSHNAQETYYNHGSYPKIDKYIFYLSYHAMFVVAAKLLSKMPVVHRSDWCEDEWGEWLSRHFLTCIDKRWLADRRDPLPLLRRDWIYQTKSKSWFSDVKPNDFLDGLLLERDGETWMNVFGSWEDGDGEYIESYFVSTALVSPETSQSLLNALTTCQNQGEYKIPEYEEKNMEFENYPFELKGWIFRKYTEHRLDEYDPYAGQIVYPPYQVGQSIADKLHLSSDLEQREWFLSGLDKPSLLCELWSTNKLRPDEDPIRAGSKISASLVFLKKLCLTMKCEIVFEVQISRRFRSKLYMGSDEENGYRPPHSKIYILSKDGKLRDTETHYRLGEVIG